MSDFWLFLFIAIAGWLAFAALCKPPAVPGLQLRYAFRMGVLDGRLRRRRPPPDGEPLDEETRAAFDLIAWEYPCLTADEPPARERRHPSP